MVESAGQQAQYLARPERSLETVLRPLGFTEFLDLDFGDFLLSSHSLFGFGPTRQCVGRQDAVESLLIRPILAAQ